MMTVDRLKQELADVYQCFGQFLGTGVIPDEDIERVLDNITAAIYDKPRPHDPLLPWPNEKSNDE